MLQHSSSQKSLSKVAFTKDCLNCIAMNFWEIVIYIQDFRQSWCLKPLPDLLHYLIIKFYSSNFHVNSNLLIKLGLTSVECCIWIKQNGYCSWWSVYSVFLTQIISCRRESCIMSFTSAKMEFVSAIFKKLYFCKYSIKRCCKQITPFRTLSDHTNKFLIE